MMNKDVFLVKYFVFKSFVKLAFKLNEKFCLLKQVLLTKLANVIEISVFYLVLGLEILHEFVCPYDRLM